MPNVSLLHVDHVPDAWQTLYVLLSERAPHESISHKAMPNVEDHRKFLASEPYLAWYLVIVDDEAVGCAYLSHQREIGISILKTHRGLGYGTEAVKQVMAAHPGKFLANINPQNNKSQVMFGKLGFKPLQVTLIHE